MLEVIEDPNLKVLKTIGHGFFTRQGGVSRGIYSSLNCAYNSHDELSAVEENLRRALAFLGHPLHALTATQNVHGNNAVIAVNAWQREHQPAADALVTTVPGLVLGSDSADCPIVLFADEKTQVVGLAHAGWRGAKEGILEATLEKMIALGAKAKHISAALSPCIAQPFYEVSTEFYQTFVKDGVENSVFFKNAPRPAHYLFDLLAYVKGRLAKLNIEAISSEVAFNTYEDEERFFSCRRAKHRNEPYFGGQLSAIYLK